MAKISIIIPMYNSSNTLKRCIDSVLCQTYQDFEIILVDDGSTDDTRDVVSEYINTEDRITYVYKENGGVSSARNMGIEKSQGEYITFVDPDDMLSKEALYEMISILEKENCDFVRCNYYLSNEQNLMESEGKILYNHDILIKDEKNKKEVLLEILNGNISTFVWVLMLRKEFVCKLNPFNENIDYMEDKLFYIDIFSKSNNYYLSNKCTYYYFYKKFNSQNIKYWEKYLANINIVYNQIPQILNENNEWNLKVKELVNIAGASQLNEVIYKMFCINNNLNIEEIWNLCNINLENKNKISKNNISNFSKYCLKLVSNNKYQKLKKIYKLKYILKQRGK